MNKYYQLILILFLTGLTSRVVADALDYTFVSVGYSEFLSTIEGFSEVPEGSGVSLDLSVAIRPHIAVIAGYTMGSVDGRTTEGAVEADIKSALIGVMVHLPINDTTDFIVAMGFINGNAVVDIDGVFAGDVDADGGVTTMGARSMVADKVEINGFINKKTIEDISKFNISLGTAYYFSESASVDLAFLLDSDSGSIAFGATKYF